MYKIFKLTVMLQDNDARINEHKKEAIKQFLDAPRIASRYSGAKP